MTWNVLNDPNGYFHSNSKANSCVSYGAPFWALAFLLPQFPWKHYSEGAWLSGLQLMASLCAFDTRSPSSGKPSAPCLRGFSLDTKVGFRLRKRTKQPHSWPPPASSSVASCLTAWKSCSVSRPRRGRRRARRCQPQHRHGPPAALRAQTKPRGKCLLRK